MRVRILLLLILKSRTLTTITQRIERDVKNSGIMQQYSGTPGVKSNFRDYPGKSGRVGRSGQPTTTTTTMLAQYGMAWYDSVAFTLVNKTVPCCAEAC